MPRQLSFDLPVRSATGREDFFLSPSNELAVAEIDRWRDWPSRKLLLIGPEGSGKTHLTQVWATEADAKIIPAQKLRDLTPEPGHLAVEDVPAIAGDPAAEEALFHWHNLVLAEGGTLMMTGSSPAALWPLSLPDLASRILGTPSANLEPPDDILLQVVLLKLFSDRQITPLPSLIPWLLKRMDRSFAEAGRIVTLLDSYALGTGRHIGPKLAAEALENSGERDSIQP